MTTPGTKMRALCVATRCTTVEQFVATFHRFCGDDQSFFVATMTSRPIGLETPFSIQLADKQPVLRGLCIVLDAWATPENRYKRPGIRLGIKRLTADSQVVFDRLRAAAKRPAELAEPSPPPGPPPVGAIGFGSQASPSGRAGAMPPQLPALASPQLSRTARAATATPPPVLRPPAIPPPRPPESKAPLPRLRGLESMTPVPPVVTVPPLPSATGARPVTPPALPVVQVPPRPAPAASVVSPAPAASTAPEAPASPPAPAASAVPALPPIARPPSAAARSKASSAPVPSLPALLPLATPPPQGAASAAPLPSVLPLATPPPLAATSASPSAAPPPPPPLPPASAAAPTAPASAKPPAAVPASEATPDGSSEPGSRARPAPIAVTRFQVALNVSAAPPPIDDVEFRPQELQRRQPRIVSEPPAEQPSDLLDEPGLPSMIVDRPSAGHELPPADTELPPVDSELSPRDRMPSLGHPEQGEQGELAARALGLAAAADLRTPGSAFVLPANPLQDLSDESLEGFVDCTLYEETVIVSPASDGAEWTDAPDEAAGNPRAEARARVASGGLPAMPFDTPPALMVRTVGETESLRFASEQPVRPASPPGESPAPFELPATIELAARTGSPAPDPAARAEPPAPVEPPPDPAPRRVNTIELSPLLFVPEPPRPPAPGNGSRPVSATDVLFAPLHDRPGSAASWLERTGAAYRDDAAALTPPPGPAPGPATTDAMAPGAPPQLPFDPLMPAMQAMPVQPLPTPPPMMHPAGGEPLPQAMALHAAPMPPHAPSHGSTPFAGAAGYPHHGPHLAHHPSFPAAAELVELRRGEPRIRPPAPAWQRWTIIAGTALVAIIVAFVIARRIRGPVGPAPAPRPAAHAAAPRPAPSVHPSPAPSAPARSTPPAAASTGSAAASAGATPPGAPARAEPRARGDLPADSPVAGGPAGSAAEDGDVPPDDDGEAVAGGTPVVGSGPCRFTVATTPAGSIVRIDDQSLGTSPITIEGTCDKHKVDVSHARYQNVTRWVAPTADKPQEIDISLPRPIHAVTVTSFPPGAELSIDGHRAGTTPTVVQVMGFATVNLRFTKQGFQSVTRKVYSKTPQDRVFVKLMR